MEPKKPNTKKKHEQIFIDIECLLKTKMAGTVWEACEIVGKKNRMTPPSVAVTYYVYRKKKQANEKINTNNEVL